MVENDLVYIRIDMRMCTCAKPSDPIDLHSNSRIKDGALARSSHFTQTRAHAAARCVPLGCGFKSIVAGTSDSSGALPAVV